MAKKKKHNPRPRNIPYKPPCRPRRLANKNLREAVLDMLRAGATQRETCAYFGISSNTLHDHKAFDPEFNEQVGDAVNAGKARLIKCLSDAAGSDWRAALAALERRWSKEWGKQPPNKITPEQLAMSLTKFVLLITPMIPAEKHAELQQKISELLASIALMGA